MTVVEARKEIINRLRCQGILHTEAPWAPGLIDPVLDQLVATFEPDDEEETRTTEGQRQA